MNKPSTPDLFRNRKRRRFDVLLWILAPLMVYALFALLLAWKG